MMEMPLRDNTRSAEVTVAVHPAQRRRGVGTALVEAMTEHGRADGRLVLNAIVDVPLDRAADHASLSFAPKVGFEPMLSGNIRHLTVPMEDVRMAELRAEVARAREADAYRVLTFEAPWPADYLQDQCALFQCMSTDEPHGDEGHEEEIWDAERVGENDGLRAARGARYLIAVAQHIASGRLVACTELCIGAESPAQAFQMLTVVDPTHRGHRLGLAIKLANLDLLGKSAPEVRVIVTGNASVNAPDDRRERHDGLRGCQRRDLLAEGCGRRRRGRGAQREQEGLNANRECGVAVVGRCAADPHGCRDRDHVDRLGDRDDPEHRRRQKERAPSR